MLGLVGPVGLVTIRLEPKSVVVIASVMLLAALFLYKGIGARRHRQDRQRKVSDLRAMVLEVNDETTVN